MVSYSTMALNGRIAAAETAHQPHRAITEYRWREEPTTFGHWVEPCPPFVMERQWRVETNGTHWEIDVVLSCGHVLQHIAYGITGDGHIPQRFSYAYPIGKKKRCATCPPVQPKPAPADEVRCTGLDGGGPESETRRCRTRARWTILHETPAGERSEVDRLCERHRREGERGGYILPEPRPHPYGYTDGGWDVVEKFTPPAAGSSGDTTRRTAP